MGDRVGVRLEKTAVSLDQYEAQLCTKLESSHGVAKSNMPIKVPKCNPLANESNQFSYVRKIG
jgi:hypothetical protein